MKFWEAMKAMLEGDKVRSIYWKPGEYLALSKNGELDAPGCFDECGASKDCELHAEWEKVE